MRKRKKEKKGEQRRKCGRTSGENDATKGYAETSQLTAKATKAKR
jgi:hypothetical protein